jgi:MFS family permease
VTVSPGHNGRPAAGHRPAVSPFRQPKAVWAVAFACVVSFMGIGLVDPILPALSRQLKATPSSVELLFTSYLVVTAVAMLVTGWVSSRIGGKRTLVAGLILIVACSALAGASHSIGEIIGFRAVRSPRYGRPPANKPGVPGRVRPIATARTRQNCGRAKRTGSPIPATSATAACTCPPRERGADRPGPHGPAGCLPLRAGSPGYWGFYERFTEAAHRRGGG